MGVYWSNTKHQVMKLSTLGSINGLCRAYLRVDLKGIHEAVVMDGQLMQMLHQSL